MKSHTRQSSTSITVRGLSLRLNKKKTKEILFLYLSYCCFVHFCYVLLLLSFFPSSSLSVHSQQLSHGGSVSLVMSVPFKYACIYLPSNAFEIIFTYIEDAVFIVTCSVACFAMMFRLYSRKLHECVNKPQSHLKSILFSTC